jgi:hypothetical protein
LANRSTSSPLFFGIRMSVNTTSAFFLQAFRSFFTVAHFGTLCRSQQCLHYATSQPSLSSTAVFPMIHNPQHLDYPRLRVELLVFL